MHWILTLLSPMHIASVLIISLLDSSCLQYGHRHQIIFIFYTMHMACSFSTRSLLGSYVTLAQCIWHSYQLYLQWFLCVYNMYKIQALDFFNLLHDVYGMSFTNQISIGFLHYFSQYTWHPYQLYLYWLRIYKICTRHKHRIFFSYMMYMACSLPIRYVLDSYDT